ncbi:MAG TPA: type II toxin-antitoxin system VapC family toxin, partial [Gemmatimonadaceae bacterium]|nr:type II toxin-antitoxin system VapC family toxin [Gemmatimonadaceae bacterium]
ERRLLRAGETIHAPALLDVEVAQVLRRYALRGELTAARGAAAIATLSVFPLHRYSHEPLLPRMWKLRENLTAYDAAYVALAEALDAPLLTGDSRLASASGIRATIELFE